MNPIFSTIIETFHLLATVFKVLPSHQIHECKFHFLWAHTQMHWLVRRQILQVPRIQNETELHNTSQLSTLIFKCTQTKSNVLLKSRGKWLGELYIQFKIKMAPGKQYIHHSELVQVTIMMSPDVKLRNVWSTQSPTYDGQPSNFSTLQWHKNDMHSGRLSGSSG